MKKLLLFTLMFTLIGGTMQAQECVPDSSIDSTMVGVFPLPDTVDSPTSVLNSGCVDREYEMIFTAVVPASITDPIALDLTSVRLDSITGLPDGLSYSCEPNDCIFLGGSSGCLVINGTPTEEGTFDMIVYTVVNDILPVEFPGLLLDGQYRIFVTSEAECPVSIDNAFQDALGMYQNVPNPFSGITTIEMDSQISGEFDFKVFNLIGKMVHSEQVDILVGENTIIFDGSRLEEGMYFYSFGQGSSIATKRMVINR